MNIPKGLAALRFRAIAILGVLALLRDRHVCRFQLYDQSNHEARSWLLSLWPQVCCSSWLFLPLAGNGIDRRLLSGLCCRFNTWSNIGVATSNRMYELSLLVSSKATYTERKSGRRGRGTSSPCSASSLTN